MHWQIKAKKPIKTLSDLKKVLLDNRQVVQPESFFNPLDPQTITAKQVAIDQLELQKAVVRIKQAVAKKEEVLIFGDYDADGVCSSAIIWESLYQLGLKAQVFIPDRQQHGYGISLLALSDIARLDKKPQLIITVDNGIVAHPALEKAREIGIEVIVTDHHLADQQSPLALALVHSEQLAGAGVAWILAKELLGKPANSLLDLVALATIADQVPLLAFNRALVVAGLKVLAQNKRLGLNKLMQVANLDPQKITVEQIAFGLAPRINAMGRLGLALDALRLLCTRNSTRASNLAVKLQKTNQQRQDLTNLALEDAKQNITTQSNDKIFLLYQADYHPGVVGLIAGKLVEQLAKPVLVMSQQDKIIKGSARSVPGIDITAFLRQFQASFLELGGHAMASGFSFSSQIKEELFAQLITKANQQFASELLLKQLDIEASLDYSLLNNHLLDLLEQFQPFGQQNPEPIFALFGLTLTDVSLMGKQQQHARLSFAHSLFGGKALTVLAWNYQTQAKQLELGKNYDLAVSISRNNWNGQSNLQAVLKDLQTAKLLDQ